MITIGIIVSLPIIVVVSICSRTTSAIACHNPVKSFIIIFQALITRIELAAVCVTGRYHPQMDQSGKWEQTDLNCQAVTATVLQTAGFTKYPALPFFIIPLYSGSSKKKCPRFSISCKPSCSKSAIQSGHILIRFVGRLHLRQTSVFESNSIISPVENMRMNFRVLIERRFVLRDDTQMGYV